MRIGDIVTLAGRHRPGFWIFAGRRDGEIPPGKMGKFISPSQESIVIGIESATPICCPVFTPGDVVKFNGGEAVVQADGEDAVTLGYGPARVLVPKREHAGEHFEHSGKSSAPRAELVRLNISKFTGEAQ